MSRTEEAMLRMRMSIYFDTSGRYFMWLDGGLVFWWHPLELEV
jgi:hypothetical protein